MQPMTTEELEIVLKFLATADIVVDTAIERVRGMDDPRLSKWVEKTESHWLNIKRGVQWLQAIARQQYEAAERRKRKE